MGISYKIYSNDGFGGPVDYSTPAADVSALTWDSPPLAAGGSYTFAVHPYDTVTGYEDRTADSRVSIALDDTGEDTAGLPAAPLMLSARPADGGTARVVWYYPQGLPVSGFHVYAWDASGPEDWVSPVGSVSGSLLGAEGSHARPFRFTLTGLSDGVVYSVGVRGYNAAGEGRNTGAASVTGRSSGPSAVVGLTATVSG